MAPPAPKKVPMKDAGPDTVYQATYSGVPVYELIVGKEIVMRRRSDDWLNATHLLKVAAFDKPQRTRILEREVQKGVHEKIQGGYGKSQGTWVPFDRGLALARQYTIEHLIRPLLELDTGNALPQAPKHVTAPPSKSKKKLAQEAAAAAAAEVSAPTVYIDPAMGMGMGMGGGMQMGGRMGYHPAHAHGHPGMGMAMHPHAHAQMGMHPMDRGSGRSTPPPMQPDGGIDDDASGDEESLSASPSGSSSSSRTPSPIQPHLAHHQQLSDATMHSIEATGGYDRMMPSSSTGGTPLQGGQKRKADDDFGMSEATRQRMDLGVQHQQPQQLMQMDMPGVPIEPAAGYMTAQPATMPSTNPETYANIILDYFISEKARIPDILTEPPRDFDPNVAIDDDGHTALHWACAMGRLRVVKLLLTAGADIFRVNHSEQTALMRSVMFSNNYDVRKFPELYQLLHRSTLNIDKSNRTVFHHIADVALSKGKTHAARYYMETILAHLEDFPAELEDVINFQDEDGETALTLAARARSKRLVKALLDHGADPKLANRDGKSAEDYIVEDERFRSSPYHGTKMLAAEEDLSGVLPVSSAFAPQLYHSEAAQLAAGKGTTEMSGMLDSLAQSFDAELQQKEKDVVRSDGLLASLKSDISDAQKQLQEITQRTEPLEAELARLQALEAEVEQKMVQRFQQAYAAWKGELAQRQQAWEAAGRPDGDEWRDVREVANPPADDGSAESAARASVFGAQQEMAAFFKQFVKQQADVGTGPKMAAYRRLIGAACGGVQPAEVDGFVSSLLETLSSEGAAAGSANGVTA